MAPNFLFFEGFETILRYAILFGEAVYVVYSFILVREVRLMNSSFSTIMQPVFLLLARLHLLVGIGLLFLSMLLLL